MKKVIILIGLVTSLMITGCMKNEEPKEAEVVTTIVYCDSCGEESNEVTKFCSSCGEEAKWVSEKFNLEETKEIEIKEEDKEVKEQEKIENNKHLDVVNSKNESHQDIEEELLNPSNKGHKTCDLCGENFDIGIEGYCSEDCYNIAINTKADGYYDNRCKSEFCFVQGNEKEMNEQDGYCNECWIQSCQMCEETFIRTSLNFYKQDTIIYCDSCDSIARNCKNGFPICDGCEMCI